MTVFSGFFNSNQNHDRMYNASDFGKFFDGLISDGVYVNFPEDENDPTEKAFYVKPGSSGLTVSVAKGRAWFLSTYTYNDAAITITLDPVANNLQSRIDAIVIDVNTGDAARANTITVVKGTQGTNPDRPSLISQATHKQYPIAFVTVVGGATSISETNIVQTVGTTDPDAIPAVEALLEYSSRTKAELEQQIAAKTFPNLANTLATESTEIDSDNDYLISQKVSNNTAGAYVRKTWGMVVSWLRKKISAEKGLVYDSATGKIKMALRSETKLDNNSAKATEVQGRVYPVELDKSGYPSVNVPWTDNNTNNAVTQTPSSDNKNYELLMSYTNDNTQRTEGARKSSDLLYNPSTKTLSVPNLNPTNPLPVSKGGTGTNDGTLNGVKLAKSGDSMGYYDANGNFKSFRQPTGNAVPGDVLSGKTFANADNDTLTGTMLNFSTNPEPIAPSGGTGVQRIQLTPGFHQYVDVDRTAPYNAGYSSGNTAGYNSGYSDGRTQGRADKSSNIYRVSAEAWEEGGGIKVRFSLSYHLGNLIWQDTIHCNIGADQFKTKTLYTSYSGKITTS